MSTFILSNSTYNRAKHLVQVVLPAMASLYFGLSQIFAFPATEEVVGTTAVVTTFLGAILGVSTRNYNNSPNAHDGEMVVVADGGGVRTFSLEVNGDPDDLALKNVITFKVRKTTVPEPPSD